MNNELLLSKYEKYKDMFLNEKRVLNCSNNTIITYLNVLNHFYEFLLDHDSLENITDINKDILLSFLNRDKNIATSTKSSRLRVLKSFFSFIDYQEQEEGRFALRFKKLTIKQEHKESEALTPDEVKRLLALFEKKTKSFNKNRDAMLIKLIIFTGIRASECLDLTLDDFREIDVPQDRKNIIVYKIRVQGKGNKERYVYITKDKIQREFTYLIENNYITDYIAITNQQKRMSRVGLYNVISNKMKKALINKKGVHILRHTFARDLVSKNINLHGYEIKNIISTIENGSLSKNFKTYKEHIQHVNDIISEKKHKNICPRCNNELVLRIAKNGSNQGKQPEITYFKCEKCGLYEPAAYYSQCCPHCESCEDFYYTLIETEIKPYKVEKI